MAYFDDIHDKILCPYCKYSFYKEEFFPDNDESTEIECEGCGKTYIISTTFTRSFTTSCGELNNNDCDYEVYKYDGKEHWNHNQTKIYSICKNCEETVYVDLDKLKK